MLRQFITTWAAGNTGQGSPFPLRATFKPHRLRQFKLQRKLFGPRTKAWTAQSLAGFIVFLPFLAKHYDGPSSSQQAQGGDHAAPQSPLRVQLGQPGARKWLPTYSRPAAKPACSARGRPQVQCLRGGLAWPKAVTVAKGGGERKNNQN